MLRFALLSRAAKVRLSLIATMCVVFLASTPMRASNFREGVSLTPSLTFNTLTTTVSAPLTATLTNTNKGALPINDISISGTGFTIIQNTCPHVLHGGASCAITITFASSTAGTFAGALTFSHDDGPGGSVFVALSGTAVVPVPVVQLSPASLTVPSLIAGSTSAPQVVQLTNIGTADLNLTSIALAGTGVNLFHENNNCGSVVTVGSSCNISITFAPLVPGSYSAQIVLTDNAADSPQSVPIAATATPCVLSINTSVATDWKINDCALSLDFNPSKGRIFGIHLAGYPDNLVDTSSSNMGIYMDNAGFGSGTNTYSYVNAGSYLDWSVTTASNASNAYTESMHFVVYPNDPGIHTYFVATHSTTDIAGGIGQVQWVYRSNLNDFNNTYSVNPDLSNPGPIKIPLPLASESFSTDPGRAVSDATVDLHGFMDIPAGFTRSFYTKYDYSSYNYLHQAHGTYGSTFGTWTYIPSNESLVAGPTKQNLIFTGNLLMIEAFSNHLDNELALTTPKGTASSRLFGPYYIHFNTFGKAYNNTGSPINTPDDMYTDTLQAGASLAPLYDSEAQLLASGYVPSTNRGSVSIQVNNVSGAPKTAWAVLSDPGKNHQLSSQGYQYWADISNNGTATIMGVVPGTYRLSVYDLGRFGEFREDGIVVNANSTTTVPAVTFVPEKFGGETVFTIGTPDRSSHEFLHGHDAAGHDDREFFGAWNYWADFANTGSVLYNATAGPAGSATNDLTKWNYNHWGVFDPGLFGGVYSSSDDTTDGYKYVIPTYVATLTGHSGTNGVTTRTPTWTVHFASPADVANYQASGYVVLSAAMACDYGSYVITLNGTSSSHTRTWSYSSSTESDCAVRSGLSGYTQWVAFQFPASFLNAAGADNVMTLGVSQTYGVMDDALRLELSNTGAAPSTTGWNDYEYVPTSSTSNNLHANDALPNP